MARPVGSTNRQSKAIKDMIKAALDRAGGEEYFFRQSTENPTAFMSLIAKVIPAEIIADVKHQFEPLVIRSLESIERDKQPILIEQSPQPEKLAMPDLAELEPEPAIDYAQFFNPIVVPNGRNRVE